MWDVVIVGGGPAAVQAGISLASEGLKVRMIERDRIGGQIGQTPMLENFVAANGGTPGPQFAAAMEGQALKMGVNVLYANVTALHTRDGVHFVVTDQGTMKARVVILATGNAWAHLDIPGMKDGIQAGRIHYGPVKCLSLDCKGQEVAVYGGGPSAGQAILTLAGSARRVNVLMRGTLKMPQYLVDRITNCMNTGDSLSLRNNTVIERVEMEGDRLCLHVQEEGRGASTVKVTQLFVCAGLNPATDWLPVDIHLGQSRKVLVGQLAGSSSPLGTSVPGIFAIGDCREGSTARVSAAIGDGAHVSTEVWRYFGSNPVCSTCTGVA
jgi:thioredoxin reductase (NADPH)